MLFSEDTWEAPKWFEHVKYEMLTRHLLDIPASGPNLPFLSLLSPSLYANPPRSCPVPEWPQGFSAFSPEYSAPRTTAPPFYWRPRGPPVRQAATCPMVVSSIPRCPGPAETYKQVGREENAPSKENGKLWDTVKIKALAGPAAWVSRVRECFPQRGRLSVAMNDFSSRWPPSLRSLTPQRDGHCRAAGKKLFPCTRHSR